MSVKIPVFITTVISNEPVFTAGEREISHRFIKPQSQTKEKKLCSN